MRTRWLEKSADVCLSVRNGSRSPQWRGAWWCPQCRVWKSFVVCVWPTFRLTATQRWRIFLMVSCLASFISVPLGRQLVPEAPTAVPTQHVFPPCVVARVVLRFNCSCGLPPFRSSPLHTHASIFSTALGVSSQNNTKCRESLVDRCADFQKQRRAVESEVAERWWNMSIASSHLEANISLGVKPPWTEFKDKALRCSFRFRKRRRWNVSNLLHDRGPRIQGRKGQNEITIWSAKICGEPWEAFSHAVLCFPWRFNHKILLLLKKCGRCERRSGCPHTLLQRSSAGCLPCTSCSGAQWNQLEVEEEDGDWQEEEEEVESGEGESRRVRHVDDHGWKWSALRTWAMRCACVITSCGTKMLLQSSVHVRHASVEVQVHCVNVVIGVVLGELLVVRVVPIVCDDAVIRRTLVFIALISYPLFSDSSFRRDFSVLGGIVFAPPRRWQ